MITAIQRVLGRRSFATAKALPGSALERFGNYGILECPLLRRRAITHDTIVFRFGLPREDDILGIGVGQHIEIVATLPSETEQNAEIRRKYTPITKVTERGHFDLLIKVYPSVLPGGQGVLSRYLYSLREGDKINIRGPIGRFNYLGKGQASFQHTNRSPQVTKTFSKICFVAGGTGITPGYQVIQAVLDDPSDKTELHLLCGNRTESDILLREELERLSKTGQLKVYHALNSPPPTPSVWQGLVGVINGTMMKEVFPTPGDDVLLTTCGPPQMNSVVVEEGSRLGFRPELIFKF
eukprot:TRINITY_DN2046_c0_g1_i7.p1 TRINITY_DN2046_c0_g1~~TRINITY_DN2046_c0_g1_i7.p1  ORF type:complete len:295 (-),score=38.61 TRINITY_DN2046_c0_g1_i7:1069-1953(-)